MALCDCTALGRFDLLDLENKDVLCFLAKLLNTAYNPNYDETIELATQLLGEEYDITFIANSSSPIPGCFVIYADDIIIVGCSGTSNFQQVAIQTSTVATGGTNFGNYTTSPLWQATSTRIIEMINEWTSDNTIPVVLLGHSLGACAVTVTAARLKNGNPFRMIKILTLGSPKAGDVRLRNITSTIEHKRLVNDGDPIPSLAPDLTFLAPLGGLVGILLANVWASWVHCGEQWRLNEDGTLERIEGDLGRFVDISAIVGAILTATVADPFEPHYRIEYINRLCDIEEEPEDPPIFVPCCSEELKPKLWCGIVGFGGDPSWHGRIFDLEYSHSAQKWQYFGYNEVLLVNYSVHVYCDSGTWKCDFLPYSTGAIALNPVDTCDLGHLFEDLPPGVGVNTVWNPD